MAIGETELREFLVRRLAQYCELTLAEVDPNRLLLEYGLTSRDAIAVTGELEDLLDRPLQPTTLWRYPTLNQMVRGLFTEAQEIAIIGTAQGLTGETEEIEWEALERAGIAPNTIDRDRMARFAESSPLSAAHRAIQSLRESGADLALVTGIGESGSRAVVVLKRFPDAERDGDRIVAVLNDNATPPEIEKAKPASDFDALVKASVDNSTTISDGTVHLAVRRIRQSLAESPLQGVGHFVLSDISLDRICTYAGALANHLRIADAGLADIAYTLTRRLGRGPIRAAVVARDRQELIAGLTALSEDHTAVVTGQVMDPPPAPVWVFPRHSPTWQNIQPLAEAEPEFATTLDELDKLLHWATGMSIRDSAPTPAHGFAVQVALGLLWRQHGVVPVAVVGIDEVAAQVIAGVLSATDGAQVIAGREPSKTGEPRIPFYSSVEEAAKDGHQVFTQISLDPTNPVIEFHRQLANLEVQGHPVEQTDGRVIDLPVPEWRRQ